MTKPKMPAQQSEPADSDLSAPFEIGEQELPPVHPIDDEHEPQQHSADPPRASDPKGEAKPSTFVPFYGMSPEDFWRKKGGPPVGSDLKPTLQRQWCWINPMGEFCPLQADRANPLFLNDIKLHQKYWHLAPPSMQKRGKISEVLLMDPKTIKVDGFSFWPGRKRLVVDQGRFCLNLWSHDARPPAVILELHDPQEWLDLMMISLLSGYEHQNERDQVFQAIERRYGWIRQKPGEKLHTAMYFLGMQGTGKTSSLEVGKELVGAPNVAEVNITAFDDKFTDSYVLSELVLIDEVERGRRDTGRAARLKRLITNNTMPYEGKGTKSIPVVNRANVIMAGNPTDAFDFRDDRRVVLGFAAIRPEDNPEIAGVIDRFVAWFGDRITPQGMARREKAVAQLARYYSNPTLIAGFNPGERAPTTSIKARFADSNRPEWERELEDRLLNRLTPLERDCVNIEQVIEVFRRETGLRVEPSQVRNLLKRHGAVPHDKSVYFDIEAVQRGVTRVERVHRKAWVIRDVKTYQFESDEMKTAWVQKKLKEKIEPHPIDMHAIPAKRGA
jgi:hypothetical protein